MSQIAASDILGDEMELIGAGMVQQSEGKMLKEGGAKDELNAS